jgi:hypothetical protein
LLTDPEAIVAHVVGASATDEAEVGEAVDAAQEENTELGTGEAAEGAEAPAAE